MKTGVYSVLFLMLTFFSCSSEKKPTLYLFTWSGFFKPEVIENFEERFQCRVVIDTYDSNESMYAKLKLAKSDYDLIFPSNYYLELLKKQKLILPLDRKEIPNLKNLDPRYYKNGDPIFGVPFLVSFSGIAYRKDRVELTNPSWDVFGRKDLAGRMTMLNDIRDALGVALKYLGHSVNTRDPVQVEKAGDVLVGWKKNLAKFESEQYKNGLATAEFLVSHAYSIDVMQLQTEEEEVDFAFPKEGAIMAVDYIALSSGSKNQKLAQAFINYMLDPEVAADNMSFNTSLMPVLPAYQLLDPEIKNSPILFPNEEDLEKAELIQDLQGDIKYYYQAWERVKGS